MEWKQGDIAICVKVGPLAHSLSHIPGECPPLRLNGEYIVQDVTSCRCGLQTLDVGIASSSGNWVCTKCGRATTGEPIWWCFSGRFIKKDMRTEEEKLAEAVLNEDYEEASRIQKQKQ